MVISLEPNSTPPTWMSFHFLSFAHTQAVFAISSLVPHTSVQLTNLDVAVVHAPHVRSLHPALGFVGGGTLTRVVGADMVCIVLLNAGEFGLTDHNLAGCKRMEPFEL